MYSKKYLAGSFIGFGALIFVLGLFLLLKERSRRELIEKDIDQMRLEQVEFMKQASLGQCSANKLLSKGDVWRPMQDQIRDTVVQVFAQVADLDMLQPYRTPSQYSATGTAFFINESGELATNAHVVSQARAVWIQIPSLGKRIIDVDVLGISPERDLALLKLRPAGIEMLKRELGHIPFLMLGNSDTVRRADEVLALGYPLSQQSLKSTTGVVSGRESHFIQTSAPINPGNSGGPLLNANGEVVGVNTAYMPDAQNVGYAVPVNDLKIVIPDLHDVRILHRPYLGILYNNATDALVEFLGNPNPGGCYITEVVKNSTLGKAGLKSGDMIYSINGYDIDLYGEMRVPWAEDKISIQNYVLRLSIGDEIRIAAYRKGKKYDIVTHIDQVTLPAVRRVYPIYEDIDYEVFGGMVVMELTLNHVALLMNRAPGLARYMEQKSQSESALIVTHIFKTSRVFRIDALREGSTINEVNGDSVHTLADFRNALKKGLNTNFLTLKVSDNIARVSDNIFVVIPFNEVLAEEPRLAHENHYQVSDISKQLIASARISESCLPVTA